MYCLLFLLVAVHSAVILEPILQEPVKVSLYYESMCPYSQEFVVEQLQPGFQKINESVLLDLVPYGKANQTKVDNKWTFECQHGPRECLGNKIQACVLATEAPLYQKLSLIACVLNFSNPSCFAHGRKCAKENGISWLEIENCTVSDRGSELLAQYGDRTRSLDPKLKYVPHILFNGISNRTLEKEARGDFLKAVCQLYLKKPPGCSTMVDRKIEFWEFFF